MLWPFGIEVPRRGGRVSGRPGGLVSSGCAAGWGDLVWRVGCVAGGQWQWLPWASGRRVVFGSSHYFRRTGGVGKAASGLGCTCSRDFRRTNIM